MLSINITIINKLGLHARAAAKLSTLAREYQCQIQIEKSGQCVDAKNIMSVMLLAACKGTELTLKFDGADEDEAITAICNLINNRFDEPE